MFFLKKGPNNLLLTKFSIAVILILCQTKAFAQEMLGTTNIKYNSTHSVILNPATAVFSPYFLSFNVVTAHAFINNNYLFIKNEDLKISSFIRGNFPEPGWKLLNDKYTPELKNGFINTRVIGPSVSIAAGKNAFGLSFSARSISSITNIPHPVAKFIFEGLYYPPQYDIRYDKSEKMLFANIELGEIGFNFSRMISNNGLHMWAMGATLKFLPAYVGSYAYSEHVDFKVTHYDTLIIYDVDAEAGLALPVNYENNDFNRTPLFRGFGAGADFGIVYSRKKAPGKSDQFVRRLCEQNYHPYLWRVGLSFLDLGTVKFTKNARQYSVKDGNLFWPGINNTHYSSINEAANDLSNRFFNDSDQLVAGNKFSVGLPSAIALIGDYNLVSDLFISATVVLPVKLAKASVMRPFMLSSGLRYETRLFHVGATASLYNNQKVSFGLHGRFANIFAGSENILGLLKISDFSGMDLYVGIRLGLLKGKCPRSSGLNCTFDEYRKFKR